MATGSSPSPETAPRILLVDDDVSVRQTYGAVLRDAGYRVEEAVDGKEGLEKLAEAAPELVLLDVDMPLLNGWQTLDRIRAGGHRGPVLMLTGRTEIDDRVRGLGGGADDYLCKPCNHRELIARVNAALRRARPPETPLPTLRFGRLVVDLVNRTALLDGGPVRLTKTEYSMLEVFARQPGRTVTRETLLEAVWGYGNELNTRTVETHIWRLRQKLGEPAGEPRWLQTVAAGGYVLVEEVVARSGPPKRAEGS